MLVAKHAREHNKGPVALPTLHASSLHATCHKAEAPLSFPIAPAMFCDSRHAILSLGMSSPRYIHFQLSLNLPMHQQACVSATQSTQSALLSEVIGVSEHERPTQPIWA